MIHEDYLERICELLDEKGYARGMDIAEKLHVAPASVTMMLKKLETAGFVTRENYRGFALTAKGKTIGLKIAKRHKILSAFLHELKLPEHIIEKDIEGMEHSLSDETLAKLEKLLARLKTK